MIVPPTLIAMETCVILLVKETMNVSNPKGVWKDSVSIHACCPKRVAPMLCVKRLITRRLADVPIGLLDTTMWSVYDVSCFNL